MKKLLAVFLSLALLICCAVSLADALHVAIDDYTLDLTVTDVRIDGDKLVVDCLFENNTGCAVGSNLPMVYAVTDGTEYYAESYSGSIAGVSSTNMSNLILSAVSFNIPYKAEGLPQAVYAEATEGSYELVWTGDAAGEPASEAGVMSFAEYMAADMDSEVTVEMYVQAHQGWWEDTVNVYAQDRDGGYFVYNLACSEEDAEKLVPGTKIRVSGTKTQWPEAVGEIEIIEGKFEFVEGADSYIAEPIDATELLGTDGLAKCMNMFASFKGMTVEASKDADGNDVPFLYKWNGSGADGDDLYFNVSVNGAVYTFVVESYLCPAGSEVYEAVKALQIGDRIDMEGFLYWYETVQPHITLVTKAE